MFQHLTQKAYLERWKTNGKIHHFSKSENRWMRPKDSAKRILGLEDMQSQIMETAFANVETCIGHTNDDALIESDEKATTFATWIALHGLRNARNAGSLKDRDYKKAVEKLAHHLGSVATLQSRRDRLAGCSFWTLRFAVYSNGVNLSRRSSCWR